LNFTGIIPTQGLKEGAWLRVEGDKAIVGGPFGGRIFTGRDKTLDIQPGTDVSYLLKGIAEPDPR
jgi:dipeptidase E